MDKRAHRALLWCVSECRGGEKRARIMNESDGYVVEEEKKRKGKGGGKAKVKGKVGKEDDDDDGVKKRRGGEGVKKRDAGVAGKGEGKSTGPKGKPGPKPGKAKVKAPGAVAQKKTGKPGVSLGASSALALHSPVCSLQK